MTGAGKSAVGTDLAKKLGRRFLDMDEHIENAEGKKVGKIMATRGVEHFRDLETDMLRTLAAKPDYREYVIATGGGVPEREENRLLMRENGVLIRLKASLPTLVERLATEHSSRPLLNGKKDWRNAIREMSKNRERYYADNDIAVQTDGLSPSEVSENICAALRKMADK